MEQLIRVAVLFGGKSGEHEVSLQSSASVVRHLDRSRFEIVPVSIGKDGRWQRQDLARLDRLNSKALSIDPEAPEARLVTDGEGRALLLAAEDKGETTQPIDVVFPVMHGPLCEDGAIQGALDLLDVAYVGCGVLGSAVSMDKDIAKRLAAAAGLPVAPYRAVLKRRYAADPESVLRDAKDALTLPVFVKPCSQGSSVGIHKVKSWDALAAALDDAFLYDVKVLIEQGIDAREIEVAVLGTEPVFTSVASEINANPQHEFYSYEAKYLDSEGATVDVPARLGPDAMDRVRGLAADAFTALECSGLARVDFFLDKTSDTFFFNELNTLPGFTSISMYPKMMEASGLPYADLLSRLVDLAIERHAGLHALKRDYQA